MCYFDIILHHILVTIHYWSTIWYGKGDMNNCNVLKHVKSITSYKVANVSSNKVINLSRNTVSILIAMNNFTQYFGKYRFSSNFIIFQNN